ncbi:MAG: DUF2796 domain-containing protein [Acidobacteriota bacterium]
MIKIVRLFGSAALALTVLSPAAAQHAAHEHGKADLNVAIETDQELVVELIVPAESVYGFEHEPKNDAEREQQAAGLRRVEQQISSALAFDGKLGCSFEKISSDSHDHDDHDDHGDHHDDHGDHGDHDDHGEDHGDHDHAEEEHSHSDVEMQWSVNCKRSIAGSKATFSWSELLPGVEEVAVVLLSAERQDEVLLKGSSGVLQF